MKRTTPWMSFLILLLLLSACSLPASRQPAGVPSAATPTLSPEQISTQIGQMLTQMPTTTLPAAGDITPAAPLPTVAVEQPGGIVVVTATPTAGAPTEGGYGPTETPAAPEATEAPKATATATAEPEAGGGVPTVAVTPLSPAATEEPTEPAGPVPTAAPGDPRSRLGGPSSTDPMNDPNAWIWPTGSDKYTRGTFSGGFQSVTALTGTDGWRMANPLGEEFTNLYLEATIRTGKCSGSDHYGLIFRVPDGTDPNQGYLFGVTCDGRYSLRRWNAEVGKKGEMKWLVNWTSTKAIATGSSKTNRLGVMTVGSRILLYANGTLLTEVKDRTYPSGYFGVLIGSDNTDNLTIKVDEMSYWLNPKP